MNNPPAATFGWKLADGSPAPDMKATMYGDWIDMQDFTTCAFDFFWTTTGSPAGTISFQVSNDRILAYTFAAETPYGPGGSPTQSNADNLTTSMAFIRAVYTPDSGGTGAVMTGRCQRKG
jgi:hypothetical protein